MAEVVATDGLIALIFALARTGRGLLAAPAVVAYLYRHAGDSAGDVVIPPPWTDQAPNTATPKTVTQEPR